MNNAQVKSLAVLNAVNLGGDTDTTAAVTGGLAGIYYGIEQIPQEWIDQIARKDDIIDLAKRLETAIEQKKSALKTFSQRERKIAVSYPQEDIEFSYKNSGYPIVKVINHSRSEQLDFSQPRYFDFIKFKQTLKSQLFSQQLDLLKIVEDNMFNG